MNVGRTSRKVASSAILTVLVSGLVIGTAAAQVASSRPTSVPTASLAERQEAIRERVQRLENTMVQLAKVLAETEPAQSERLRDALDRSGDRQIKRRVAALAEKLKQSKFSDADPEQLKLLSDMESMLTLLTNTLSDIDKKRAERERLEKLRREISTLQEQQRENLYATRSAANAEQLRAAADRLQQIADEQAKLREAPTATPEQRKAVAQQQAELSKQSRAAAEELKKMQAAAPTPESQGAIREATESSEQAAEAMKQAESKVEEAAKSAEDAQKKAEESLRRAIDRLRNEADREGSAEQARKIAEAQRAIEAAAGRVAEQFGPQNPSDAPTPGQRQVEQAQQAMKDAADRLGENQPEQAAPKEKKALDALESAQGELDDALRQIRREEMEETLTALATRFKGMLAKEEQLRDVAASLAKRDAKAWTRGDQLALAEMAQTQRSVMGECENVLAILSDEGSTLVLPDLVKQLSSDLNSSAARLDALDVGAESMAVLDDVIEVLKEIVGAIDEKQKEMQEEQDQSDQQQQGMNKDQGDPLLPGSAELKLLRSSQARINRRTAVLREAAANLPADAAKSRFAELADRQRQLAEMTRRMNERK